MKNHKRNLAHFISDRYNIKIEKAHRIIKEDKIPDSINELPYVKNTSNISKDDTIAVLTPEFISRRKYITDVVVTQITKPPQTRDAYIKQFKIPDEKRYLVREKSNYTTSVYLTETQLDDLINNLMKQINFLYEELDNCNFNNNGSKNRIKIVLSICLYVLDKKDTTNFSNIHRVLKYMTKRKQISNDDLHTADNKLDSKIELIFDNKPVADEIYEYYRGNMKPLVNCIDDIQDNSH